MRFALRLVIFASIVTVVVAGALAKPGPAGANTLVNVTINIPADVRPNPCTPGDVVNVSGRLHMIIYTRSDGNGGYHVSQHWDEWGRGTSLTTKETYTASDTREHDFYAGAPFPVTDTTAWSIELVSQGTSPNLLMHYTLHTTVTANGVPTATVDNVYVECRG